MNYHFSRKWKVIGLIVHEFGAPMIRAPESRGGAEQAITILVRTP